MKREAELKARFTQALKLRSPRFLTPLLGTAGAADRAIVGNKFVSFWEFKHGTPGFESPGLQELTCARLDAQSYCRYVIWQERQDGSDQRTLIVHPMAVAARDRWNMTVESWCNGYDMNWLAIQVRKVHE